MSCCVLFEGISLDGHVFHAITCRCRTEDEIMISLGGDDGPDPAVEERQRVVTAAHQRAIERVESRRPEGTGIVDAPRRVRVVNLGRRVNRVPQKVRKW